MQTIKLKYSSDCPELISQYINQYNHVYRFAFNKLNHEETVSQKYIKENLNNIELIDSWFISSAISEARGLVKKSGTNSKVIFGGKKNFIRRCQGKISKEEFLSKRNVPLCSVGEQKSGNTSVHGNRKFKLNQELNAVTLKLKDQKVILKFDGISNNFRYILKKIYEHQVLDDTPITYKIDNQFVYISFDESVILKAKQIKQLRNRVFAIDLNPNYIGWSIVDWKSESEFEVIKSGVYSIKELNDKEKEFKKLRLSSSDPKRIHLNNKRKFNIFQISKSLINKALYYKVNSFIIEDLHIESKDNKKGKRFNKLVNNQWLRNDLINNLIKRCNIFGIRFIKAKPEYSSFIGNFVFRSLNLPDPVLASIEIGRRGYEFINQYITKTKEIKKNIIWLDPKLFHNLIVKSLEEFNISKKFGELIDLYYLLKKSKQTYRLPVTSFEGQFYKLFSDKMLIKQLNFNRKCITL